MRVGEVVGFYFGFEGGYVAGSGDYDVSFCGEGLDELVLGGISL